MSGFSGSVWGKIWSAYGSAPKKMLSAKWQSVHGSGLVTMQPSSTMKAIELFNKTLWEHILERKLA